MTMKSYIVGRETLTMLAQATQWGAATAGSDGIVFEEAGFNWSQATAPLTLNGSYWQSQEEQGNITCALEITQPFMFNDLTGMAMALGLSGYQTPLEQNEGQGDYLHVITPASSTEGLFATIACKRGDNMYNVFPSCKFSGFELTGSVDPNRLKIKHFITADTLANNLSGLSATVFDSLVYPYDQRAYFRNCRFYLNDADSTALASGDEITSLISDFSFSFKRSLSSDYTNDSGRRIAEPLEDAAPDISFKFSLVHKDQTASRLFDDRVAATPKKLRVEVTAGPANPAAVGTVENAQLSLEFPNLQIVDDSFTSFNSMDRQVSDVTFKALAPAIGSTVAGMSFSEPFRVEIINNQPTRPII